MYFGALATIHNTWLRKLCLCFSGNVNNNTFHLFFLVLSHGFRPPACHTHSQTCLHNADMTIYTGVIHVNMITQHKQTFCYPNNLIPYFLNAVKLFRGLREMRRLINTSLLKPSRISGCVAINSFKYNI